MSTFIGGELQIGDGVPWAIRPLPRILKVPGLSMVGAAVRHGTTDHPAEWRRTRTLRGIELARFLEGGDAAFIGAAASHDISGDRWKPTDTQTILPAHELQMRANGEEVLERAAVHAKRSQGGAPTEPLWHLIRYFPLVLLRLEPVAALLSRLVSDKGERAVLRRFVEVSAKGRPPKSFPADRTATGTIALAAEHGTLTDAYLTIEGKGIPDMGSADSARARFNSQGALYRLRTGGVWVTADRLLDEPWMLPSEAEARWDIYRIPADTALKGQAQ
jgi:hypothetical protein